MTESEAAQAMVTAWYDWTVESDGGLEALVAVCARDEEASNPTIKTANIS